MTNRIPDEESQNWWRHFVRRICSPWRKPETEALREAVEELIEEAVESGVPTSEQTMLANILKMRERHVGDCMIPRADIVAIEVDASFKELLDLMTEHTHSRVPVYRETLDDAMGMVHMKDVLACLVKEKDCRIKDLLRPVLFVAPSMPTSKLLLQMRQTRQHMAMVVDEFGGIDGLATIEDLVEEVVGEIEDEHDDPATQEVIARADGTLLIDARQLIEDFEKRVGSLLQEEEREKIETLAGYVFHLAGHIPQIGETVEGPGGLKFDVLEADQNRIKRVRVRGLRRAADVEGHARG